MQHTSVTPFNDCNKKQEMVLLQKSQLFQSPTDFSFELKQFGEKKEELKIKNVFDNICAFATQIVSDVLVSCTIAFLFCVFCPF